MIDLKDKSVDFRKGVLAYQETLGKGILNLKRFGGINKIQMADYVTSFMFGVALDIQAESNRKTSKALEELCTKIKEISKLT